jgi:hypothetical protein
MLIGKRKQRTGKVLAHIECYVGADNDWYWAAIANNNRSVAISGEGYQRFVDCKAIAEALFPGTKVVIVEHVKDA